MARSQRETRVKERTSELEQAHKGLQELNQRLMQAPDEKRRRLALELHDSAGQLLVALKRYRRLYHCRKSNFKQGVGIQGMRERVRQMNGNFEIESSLSGTTVTAVLPTNWSS